MRFPVLFLYDTTIAIDVPIALCAGGARSALCGVAGDSVSGDALVRAAPPLALGVCPLVPAAEALPKETFELALMWLAPGVLVYARMDSPTCHCVTWGMPSS